MPALAPTRGRAMASEHHYRNLLLARLPVRELELLSHELVPVTLPRRTQLELPDKKIGHIYFMESGIASVVASPGPGLHVEVGIIGFEGMTGLPVVLLNDRHPYSVYIQVDATALRIEVEAVQDAMKRSEICQRVFLGFTQSFLIQTSETAVANAKATVIERLARWLLMAQDRVGSEHIDLTHEFLALMMGSRRAGVTEALLDLSQRNMVSGKRGTITIIDRAGLIQLAGRYYGVPEKELQRLLSRVDTEKGAE
jgi:CRP-like cAMP-binding protein